MAINSTTHYIYVPGLGDRFDGLRRFALKRWNSNTTTATLVSMGWSNKSETAEQKYDRLKTVIQKSPCDRVVVVGESAGGPMALLALSRLPNKVHGVITICGYNHGSADVHEHHRRNSPAFFATVQMTEKLIDTFTSAVRRRITTVYSTKDRVVEPHHTKIHGAHKIELHTKGHFTNIARTLLAGPESIDTIS